MKNQYIGDINDFRKYGLLRCFARAGMRPMLCWMLTSDDTSTDGRKREYLTRPESWRDLDPELFDFLGSLVSGDAQPTVHSIQSSGVIPASSHFPDLLEDDLADRDAYFDRLSVALSGDLAFFDPDNGFAVRSVARGRKKSSKYIYWEELEEPYERGLSLLVYQHLPRRRREVVARELLTELSRRFPGATVACLSAGAVLFLLAIRPEAVETANRALEAVSQAWGRQICRVGSP